MRHPEGHFKGYDDRASKRVGSRMKSRRRPTVDQIGLAACVKGEPIEAPQAEAKEAKESGGAR